MNFLISQINQNTSEEKFIYIYSKKNICVAYIENWFEIIYLFFKLSKNIFELWLVILLINETGWGFGRISGLIIKFFRFLFGNFSHVSYQAVFNLILFLILSHPEQSQLLIY